eukprot:9299984-Ditylum_brightwellii.AAC.1
MIFWSTIRLVQGISFYDHDETKTCCRRLLLTTITSDPLGQFFYCGAVEVVRGVETGQKNDGKQAKSMPIFNLEW